MPEAEVAELFRIDREGWHKEAAAIREFFTTFGSRLPRQLLRELEGLEERLR